jgi:hypothetical protein
MMKLFQFGARNSRLRFAFDDLLDSPRIWELYQRAQAENILQLHFSTQLKKKHGNSRSVNVNDTMREASSPGIEG